MKCPKCGRINDEDARFCEYCGISMSAIPPKNKSHIPSYNPADAVASAEKKKNRRVSIFITCLFVVFVFLALCAAEYLITGESLFTGGNWGYSSYIGAGEAFMNDFLEGQLHEACELSTPVEEGELKCAGYDSLREYREQVEESYKYLYYEHCLNINYILDSPKKLAEDKYYLEYIVSSTYNNSSYSDKIYIYCTEQNGKWYPVFCDYE